MIIIMMASMASCGQPSDGTVTRPGDSACVRPPGTLALSSGACVPCAGGTVHPVPGSVASCHTCWSATTVDAVLDVSWNRGMLLSTGLQPDAIVVAVGTSADALRWTRTPPGNATSVQLWFRTPAQAQDNVAHGAGSPPFLHGSMLHVHVRAMLKDFVIAGRRATVLLDFSPPLPGVANATHNMSDVNALADGSQVAVVWHSFHEDESSANASLWRSNGTHDSMITNGWQRRDANVSSLAVVAQPPIGVGEVIYGAVRAFNEFGAWPQEYSNGATVLAFIGAGVAVVVAADTAATGDGNIGAGAVYHAAQTSTASLGAMWQFADAGATGGGGGLMTHQLGEAVYCRRLCGKQGTCYGCCWRWRCC